MSLQQFNELRVWYDAIVNEQRAIVKAARAAADAAEPEEVEMIMIGDGPTPEGPLEFTPYAPSMFSS